MNPHSSAAVPPIQFIALPDALGRIDEDWLRTLTVAGDPPVKRWNSARPRRPGWPELLAAARTLDRAYGLMIVRSGLGLPRYWRARLAAAAEDVGPLPRLPAGNYADPVNPLFDLSHDLDAAQIDAWLWLCGDHRALPIGDFPVDCLYLPPGSPDELDEDSPALLLDSLFVHDPARPLAAGADADPAAAAALGSARLRLQALLAETGLPKAPAVGLDQDPVTLHISHDWGGGVARWIADVAAADEAGHHLVLSAGGDPRGTVHGQFLRLYAAGPGRGLVRELPLCPAIADSVVSDPRYAQMLERLIERFGVTRILVSSLIGHSLDALRTELPTAQILHDFYPAWPVLDQDPLAWDDGRGGVDLDRALAAHADQLLFRARHGAHWKRLSSAWLECIETRQLHLLAPTFEVLRRWQALTGNALPRAQVIGHGFSGWSGPVPTISERPGRAGRLNLVITGRLSPGKGLNLLDESLERLRRFADITLLGCGRHGMRFFGRPGVDILLDYQRDRLPEVLAGLGPQGALFLSTVPETWNYTLSEMRSLHIPVIATRLGSFVERIESGRTGWLFDPDPDSLLELIERLHGAPQQLAETAARAPAESDMATVLQRYWQLVPATGAVCPAPAPANPEHAAAAMISARLVASRRRVARLRERAAELEQELGERADWAGRYERLSEERTRWARSLELELEAERGTVRDLADQLDTLNKRLAESQDHLEQTRAQLARTQQDLARVEQDLARVEQNLARTEQDLARTQASLDALHAELRLILASRSWRWTKPLRFATRLASQVRRRRAWNPITWPRLARRLLHSLRFHGLRNTLHMAQGTAAPVQERSTVPVIEAPVEHERLDPVRLARPEHPRASIVIPVYNKVAYTAACLHSILDQAGPTSFEIIVVDDCSSDATDDFLARCEGLETVRNAENSGFIASCNAGAERARGEFLVFLNNDTTVTAGWLEALLETFEHFSDVGIAGARLVYPDGRLQEAGGIIFDDASGWNYGRGESPDLPQYNFASEADYVSGACLAIRTSLFAELGGFDRHYAPAYYEDTDLCFRVRQRGLKVFCQPACTIIHHEGISSGTDETSGTKRYQAVNRDKFSERWRDELGRQPPHRIDSDRPDPVRRARFHRARGRALLIDATTPMPDHDSGSVRFTAMLELMVEQGWQVTFMPQNLAWDGRYSEALQRRGVEVLAAPEVNSPEAWLKRYGKDLDLVLVSRHYVLEPLLKPIRRCCPRARLVFDTVDLHFLREQRQAELSGSESMAAAAAATRRIELKLMNEADTTLVVSPVERELLAEQVPQADVRVLSNIHTVHGRQQGWEPRRDLMFVGGFQHPPNVDAAEWLIDEIFPLIRAELPEVRLHLIGSRMPDALRARAGEGIVLHGFVEDLEPYLNGCRLSLAPLRYGAGVKGKVNQAMAWGLPVVATACAAEGMFLVHGEDVLMAADARSFAAETVRAYTDPELWQTLSDGGLANVQTYFSRAAAERVITDLLVDETLPLQRQGT